MAEGFCDAARSFRLSFGVCPERSGAERVNVPASQRIPTLPATREATRTDRLRDASRRWGRWIDVFGVRIRSANVRAALGVQPRRIRQRRQNCRNRGNMRTAMRHEPVVALAVLTMVTGFLPRHVVRTSRVVPGHVVQAGHIVRTHRVKRGRVICLRSHAARRGAYQRREDKRNQQHVDQWRSRQPRLATARKTRVRQATVNGVPLIPHRSILTYDGTRS